MTALTAARRACAVIARIFTGIVIVSIALFLWTQQASAQAVNTYVNSTDGAIDGSTTCTAPRVRNFTVANSFTVGDVDLGFFATHGWRGDIRLTLQSPAGTRVRLVDGDTTTVSGDNLNVRLSDENSQRVNTDSPTGNHSTSTPPPFQNAFSPNAALSAFDGQNSAGTWRMEICDLFPNSDSGTFRHAELYLTPAPSNFADLSINKQVNNANPASGAVVTFTITVTNSAASDRTANSVQVIDQLPLGLQYISHSGSGSYTASTGVWQVGSLAPGASAPLIIQAMVNASAGAVITNVAEVTASSQTDVDSTPGNGAAGEDDYATATFTVSGARTAGTPPVLSCPRGSSVFDWDTRNWPAGSLTRSYTLANVGTVDFAISSSGVWVNDAAFGGQSPALSTANTGSLATAQRSLHQYLDFTTRDETATTVIKLGTVVPGLQFTIFDIDYAANDFSDKLTVVGSWQGSTVLPILTNGTANYVISNTAIGDALSGNSEGNGNVVVTFQQPVDTITLVYGNHATAPAVPDGQAIGIHDITFCNPYADITVAKVSSVISDPVNGTSDPKAIPGALVQYLISVANNGVSPTDSGSIVITDDGPGNAKICFDTNGSGQPIVFDGGTPASGLSLGYVAADDTDDSLEFSDDDGATWNYTPVPDADGCDAGVTHFRLTPEGQFAAGTSFSLRTSYRIR